VILRHRDNFYLKVPILSIDTIYAEFSKFTNSKLVALIAAIKSRDIT